MKNLNRFAAAVTAAAIMTSYAAFPIEQFKENRQSFFALSVQKMICAQAEELECNGFTYTLSDAGAVITGYTGVETDLTIPDAVADGTPVTEIDRNAFYQNKTLTSLTIPSSVKSIGNYAFWGCDQLSSVTLNEGLLSIGNYAFEGCGLTSVHIPASVAAGSNYGVFNKCAQLKSVSFGEGMETIPANLFRECTGLEEITIPEGITAIGEGTFMDCTSLRTVHLPSTLKAMDEYVFEGCASLTDIVLPEGLTGIPPYAFQSCDSLAAIEIPASVLNIEHNAFWGCDQLRSVTLNEGLLSIGNYAFEGCGLTYVHIPASVAAGSNYGVFNKCAQLKSVSFGEGMETIPANLFRECTGLEEITIPEGITAIGEGTFMDCTSLRTVHLPSTLKAMDEYVFEGCASLTDIVLPEGLTGIPPYAFQSCDSLAAIEIPASVLNIEHNAFWGCDQLRSVTLNEGLLSIGNYAFEGCGLTYVHIPASVAAGSNYGVFNKCAQLKSVSFGEGMETIPANLFRECTGLEEITIPEGITAIGEGTFMDCTSLRTVHLPSTLKAMDEYVFEGCASLTDIVLPEGLTGIPPYAFQSCDSLSAIEIPASVMNIEHNAFWGCDQLRSVTLNEGLLSIGNYAFDSCAMTSITIPASVIESGIYGVFNNCDSLTYAAMAEGAASVPAYLFKNAEALQSVYLPETTENIGKYAFQNCISLSEIISDRDSFAVASNSFENCKALYDTRITYLDPAHTSFMANVQTSSVNGIVNYTVKYKMLEPAASALTGCSLALNVPDGMVLLPDSIRAKGTAFSIDKAADGLIDVTEPEGTITFSARINDYGDYTLSAAMCFDYAGESWRQSLGALRVETPALTLRAVDVTDRANVDVYGMAAPGETVQIYVNDVQVGTAEANAYTGKYSSTVTLPAGEAGAVYRLHAECGGIVTDMIEVVWEETEPVVTKVDMYFNSRMDTPLDITSVFTEGASPVASYLPYHPFRFEIDASNSDRIHRLFVTSTKGEEIKSIEAFYDAQLDAWVAEGFFDPENLNYVPGALNISVMEKTIIDVDSLVPDEMQTITLPESIESNSTCTIIGQGENGVLADVNISDGELSEVVSVYLGTDDGMFIDGIYHDITEIAADPESFGYLRTGVEYRSDNGNAATYVRPVDSEDAALAIFEDLNDGLQFTKNMTGLSVLEIVNTEDDAGISTFSMLFDSALNIADQSGPLEGIKGEVAEEMFGSFGKHAGVIGDVADYFNMGYGIMKAGDDEELIGSIIATTLLQKTLEDKELAVWGTSIALGNPVPLLFYYLSREALKDLERYNNHCLETGERWTFGGFMRFIVDPSGYVYEGNPSNRIEGARLTIYYQDPDTGEAVLWNAEDYDQHSILYSDAEGRYAWDVPEGLWQVKCELDGYDTLLSEWVPVPPVQTDINFGLVSLAAPEIVSALSTPEGIVLTFSKPMDASTLTAAQIVPADGTDIAITPLYAQEGDVYAMSCLITGDFEGMEKISLSCSGCASYAGTAIEDVTTTVTMENFAPAGLIGDVNLDGMINAVDAAHILVASAEVGSGNESGLTAEQTALADVNEDGTFNAVDAAIILCYAAAVGSGYTGTLQEFQAA